MITSNKKIYITIFLSALFLDFFVSLINLLSSGIIDFYVPSIIFHSFSLASFFVYAFAYKEEAATTLANFNQDNRYGKFFTPFFLITCLMSLLSSSVENNKYLTIALYSLASVTFFLGLLVFLKEEHKSTHKDEDQKEAPNKILLAIALVFIVLKISIPLLYTGSYIDEYTHIFSGIELFKNGTLPQFDNNTGLYTRGLGVTLLVGIALAISKTIFAAKMVPAFLGIINFFLFSDLLKKIFKCKKNIFLILAIYTISPLVIFNHTYIRMFVLYEFFLLLNLFIFFRILEKSTNKRKVLILLSLIISNILCFLLSNDLGSYYPIVASAVCISFLYFNLEKYFDLSEIQLKLLRPVRTPEMKMLIFLIGSVASFFAFKGPEKINKLTTGILTSNVANPSNYYDLFFRHYSVLTILFLIACVLIFYIKDIKQKIFVCIAMLLFLIHFFSNQAIQVNRGILYFLPIFYSVSMLGLEKLRLKKIDWALISSCIVILVVFSYPKNFLKSGPYIPYEVNYTDFKKASDFVSNNCAGKEIIVPFNQPYITEFYGITVNETTYILPELLSEDTRYTKNPSDNQHQTMYRKIKTNTDPAFFKKLDKNTSCIIVSPRFSDSGRYISRTDFNSLPTLYKQANFNFINVFY